MPELEAVPGVEVTTNLLDRDLSTQELIEPAARSSGDHRAPFHARREGAVRQLPRPGGIPPLRGRHPTIDVGTPRRLGARCLVARADKSFVPSTAEIALGLLLSVSRSIAESTMAYRAGVEPPQRPGRPAPRADGGHRIGYGAIGSYLADLLLAVGMNVVVADPGICERRAPGNHTNRPTGAA